MDKPRHEPAGASTFQTTRWSLVLAARGEASDAREALAALCGAYWYPLYAFVRRKGYNADAALDLVQGFFARLLEKRDFASVDQTKGRLRSFLMASCTHYLANQLDHDRAQKRGGGHQFIALDGAFAERRYGLEPAHERTPERLFEQRWATTLLDLVVGRLEAEMEAAGKARLFLALRPTLSGDSERIPYDVIAAELGVSNEAARAAASRLRRRFRELIREEIARTLDDPAGVDDEIHSLFAALRE